MAIQPFATQIQAPQIQTPTPINQMGQLMALRDSQQQNQMRTMQMGQLQQGIEQENALRSYLGSGADLSTPEAQSRLLSFGQTGIDAQTALRASEAANLTGMKTRLDIFDTKMEAYQTQVARIDPRDSEGFLSTFSNLTQSIHGDPFMKSLVEGSGASYERSMADAQKAAAGGPQAIAEFLHRVGDSAAVFAERQKPVYQQVEDQSGQHTNQIISGQASVVPGSETTAKPRYTGQISADQYPLLAQAIEEGRVPLTRVNSRTAGVYEAALKRTPDLDFMDIQNQQIREGASSRTAGTIEANMSIASEEARNMIVVTRSFVRDADLTNYPSLNAIENAIEKGTGDENIVRLNTSINALINSYARAINPRGVPTVSDKNHAREIINSAMSGGQLNAALDVMTTEMDAALAAAAKGGKPAAPAPAPAPAPATAAPPAATLVGEKTTQSGVKYTVEE